MGMRENWQLFIDTTKNKSKGHSKAAQYWDNIGNILSLVLIFLGAVTTFLALLKSIPSTVVAGLAAVATMLSAISAFLKPSDRRQVQSSASREFQELMMKMVRCEDENDYEQLWRSLNKAIVDAPFLAKKFKTDLDIDWTMTPEFEKVITRKEGPAEIPPQQPSPLDGYNGGGYGNRGYGSIDIQQNFTSQPKGENERIELLGNTSSSL